MGPAMLERIYWIAGIAAAAAVVIGLFINVKSKNSIKNRQNLKVSGQHNTVNQKSNIEDGGRKDS